MAQSSNILICRCAHCHKIPGAVCDRIMQGLRKAGIPFQSVHDLCGAAAAANGTLAQWAAMERLHVVACYPRAVRWLFSRAGAPLKNDVRLLNAASDDADAIVASLTADAAPSHDGTSHEEPHDEWIPWFPVIDYDRCVNCKQCLNFCLFGVYGLTPDGRVQVVNPRGCKTYCPACARVCPERAIIFPKYEKSPINGDEVDANALDSEKERSELEELLGGNVQEIIRQRTARSRFARKSDSDDLSSQQKLARLSRLQQELDIPQEVLDSLSRPAKETGPTAADCPNADYCDGDCTKQEGCN
jgi:NAD-dependent dihydropyrimidine dehydrogenase PreA subunit